MQSETPRGGRSPLLFIFLTVFIDLLGFGIVIPLLPIYSKAHGASEAALGLLFACFSGMQFLFAPMWGRLSDRIGRRPVLIGGLVGTALSYALFASSESAAVHRAVEALAGLFGAAPSAGEASMAILFVSRMLAGFFAANVSTAHAWIADVTRPEDRAKGMGIVGAAFGLGFTFGPPVGGILSQVSMALPGLLACGLSLAAAVFGWFLLPEPPRHAREASRIFSTADLRGALRDARVSTLLLMNFLAITAFAAFEAMFIRFGLAVFPATFHQPASIADATLEDVIGAAEIAGYYMFFIGIISALVQGGLIRRLVPRFGETRLAVAGPLLLGLSLAIIGAAPAGRWWVVIAGCFVLPFGLGFTNPSLAGLLSRAAPVARQGAYLGMNQSAASLARALGPFLAGLVFLLSPRAPFFSAAAILFVSALIAAAYRARYASTFRASPGDANGPSGASHPSEANQWNG